MPILRPFSTLYPRMFPAGYSGSQVLRFALKDGPEQRLYQAGDSGLAGHKDLSAYLSIVSASLGSLSASISGHHPSNLSAAVSAVRCQVLSPKKYIVGYEDGIPKFIETRQRFRCVSFISSYLKSTIETSENLPAAIKPSRSSYSDLGADLTGFPTMYGGNVCLPAVIKSIVSTFDSLTSNIVGSYCQTLSPKRYVVGYEGGIPKFLETRQRFKCVSFISGYIRTIYRTSGSLSAIIKGWVSSYSDLRIGFIKGLYSESEDFPVIIRSYATLSGSLPATVIGSYCQILSPKRYIIGYENGIPQFLEGRQRFRCVDFLSGYMKAFARSSDDLSSVVRGWISSYGDLGANLTGLYTMFQAEKCLPAVIRPYATLPGSLPAAIVGSYCQTLSPQKYVVGYEDGVPKFLDRRQRFRCVSFISGYIKQIYAADLPAYIFTRVRTHTDLPAFLNATWKQGSINLGGYLRGWVYQVPYGVLATIHGFAVEDLAAIIGMHSPGDLPARLRVFSQAVKDLPSNIYGWAVKDLLATLTGVWAYDLPAYLYSIPPKDLSAYLKVWPQKDLPANIYGWGSKNLGATIGWNIGKDLPAIIGAHPWKNLGIILRGWARQVPADLPAYIRGFTYEDMQAMIRATYFADLPAYIYGIPSKNLAARIHGWDTKDLLATLIGGYGPYDIQAYINAYNRPQDLPGFIKGRRGIKIPYDLGGIVSSWYSNDLGLYMNPIPPSDLRAYLVSVGDSSDLPAYIYPKMINLTTIISIATMEHLDIAAVINLCGGSGYKDLKSYLRCVFLKDLAASIEGKIYPSYMANLGATIGYADSYINIDRLPLTVSIASGYIIEDKLPLYIHIFRQQADLASYITATPMYTNLSASLTCEWLKEYEFENYKHKEMVYDLDRRGNINWNEVVEIVFESIVDDYFYIEANQRVHKMNKYARWVLETSSYVPENTDVGVRRKLHRMKKLYDLRRFSNIDEAIRFAINYVTEYNYGNLLARVSATGGFVNLSSYIKPKYFTTTNSDISSSITAREKTFVLAFDDKIEFH